MVFFREERKRVGGMEGGKEGERERLEGLQEIRVKHQKYFKT
jgi:hypothetical protein